MSRTAILFQAVTSTGQVIGNALGDCEVAFHGWTFSNSGAATYEVDFYVGTPPTTGSGNAPVKPSASTTKAFTIQIPATSSKEYFEDHGVFFKYGLFAIANNAAVTGGVFWS